MPVDPDIWDTLACFNERQTGFLGFKTHQPQLVCCYAHWLPHLNTLVTPSQPCALMKRDYHRTTADLMTSGWWPVFVMLTYMMGCSALTGVVYSPFLAAFVNNSESLLGRQ